MLGTEISSIFARETEENRKTTKAITCVYSDIIVNRKKGKNRKPKPEKREKKADLAIFTQNI